MSFFRQLMFCDRITREKTRASKNNEATEHPSGLKREMMPRHVAVILDGNRRWAHKKGLSENAGHEAGAKTLVKLSKICSAFGIHTLTAFAFSTENWGRPKEEVDYLMGSFERHLKSELPTFIRENIKVSIIGNTSRIPSSLLNAKHQVEEATAQNTGHHLILAIDYSGKYDILQACKSMVNKAKAGEIGAEDVTESLMERELDTKCTELPHPDLLIRTSGEQRVSNFYLWQLAYTELFFSQVLWPDFGEDDFVEALRWFQRRERRFGQRV